MGYGMCVRKERKERGLVLLSKGSETAPFIPISNTLTPTLPQKEGPVGWKRQSWLIPQGLPAAESILAVTRKINCFAATWPRMFLEMRRKSFVYF